MEERYFDRDKIRALFRILIRGLAPASHKEHVQNTHIAERHHAPAVHLVIGSAAASSVHNGGDSAWKGGRVRIYTVFCTMVKIMNMVRENTGDELVDQLLAAINEAK